MKISLFTFLLIFSCFELRAETFSVMTLNAENLFDTKDDQKKDDKAFLPLSKKQSAKSTAGPECACTLLKGGYTVHPVPAPASTKVEDNSKSRVIFKFLNEIIIN